MKKIIIDFQNAYRGENFVPSEALLNQVINHAAEFFTWQEEQELTVRLVENSEQQALNLQYRGKDYPTNILSFQVEEALPIPFLGDLVIAVDVVAKEALEQRKKVENHWAHLLVHGFLHLLGYDHQNDAEAEEMEALEIEILADLGIANPYQEI